MIDTATPQRWAVSPEVISLLRAPYRCSAYIINRRAVFWANGTPIEKMPVPMAGGRTLDAAASRSSAGFN